MDQKLGLPKFGLITSSFVNTELCTVAAVEVLLY